LWQPENLTINLYFCNPFHILNVLQHGFKETTLSECPKTFTAVPLCEVVIIDSPGVW
jgi:hypothetical protein